MRQARADLMQDGATFARCLRFDFVPPGSRSPCHCACPWAMMAARGEVCEYPLRKPGARPAPSLRLCEFLYGKTALRAM